MKDVYSSGIWPISMTIIASGWEDLPQKCQHTQLKPDRNNRVIDMAQRLVSANLGL